MDNSVRARPLTFLGGPLARAPWAGCLQERCTRPSMGGRVCVSYSIRISLGHLERDMTM